VNRLAGNGVELVRLAERQRDGLPVSSNTGRESTLAARVQAGLERIYQLDRIADVLDYVRSTDEGQREALLVRQGDDGAVEVSLRLPLLEGQGSLDAVCQIIEGVSHFVYVVERARVDREATQLELELQAEVDKWVVFAASMGAFDTARSAALRARLFEGVTFAHDEDSEAGERYRIANDVAHRFVRRLERRYVEHGRFGEMRAELRRFFHVGQEEKLRLGRAA
jgi:hypothetical protein